MHLKEIDANLLVVLDALLTDASVTKAAERLGRSPSAVSHALAALRTSFDDALFVRAGQRLVPTARARELASTVHVIVVGMESLLRASKAFDPAATQRVFSFAASEVGELALLHPLKQVLGEVAPGISLRWQPITDGVEEMRRGKIDFAIEIGADKMAAPDLKTVRLYSDPLVTLSRADHPLVGKRPLVSTFAAADHIAIASIDAASIISAALSKAGYTLRIASEASSVLSGLLLALKTDALVTVPASIAIALGGHAKFGKIRQPFSPVGIPVRLTWHRIYERDECHAWLRAQLKTLGQELASAG